VQNFPRIKNFGRLKCSKKTSFFSNHVVVRGGRGEGRPELHPNRPWAAQTKRPLEAGEKKTPSRPPRYSRR
jgi:hypothetical protein